MGLPDLVHSVTLAVLERSPAETLFRISMA